jgi:hypothetical protein
MRSGCLVFCLATLASAADWFVSPAGADRAKGSRTAPFATLERAREAARESRRRSPSEAETVWLARGEYFVNGSFELSSEDSGRAGAPTTYRAIEDGAARIVNARRIAAAEFRPVTAPATLARIPAALRGKIVELDLARLGIRHSQPYPDVFDNSGGLMELYVGGRRMPLSRYPNEGYTMMRRVLDTGGGLQDRDWPNPTNLKPAPPDSGGTFEYREDAYAHFERWARVLDRGVWLKGYWRIPWENEAVRLKAIDVARHTATLSKAIPGGIGNKYSRPEGNGAEQYWLMNLLEEIDVPGEWAVDFVDRKLYFYPPESLAGKEILIADAERPVVTVTNASYVVLRGLTVEGGLGDGVVFRGGTENLLAGCTVRNVSHNGVTLEGGARNAVVSSDLYHLGAGGVWLSGGDENRVPRVPAGHRVVNNHIHHFAEIERVYAPGVNAGYTGGGGGGHHAAVGMYVAHNLIHDTPHAGVLFGSWDSVFEFNEVFRYCTVSNDMGAFYAFDNAGRMGNITFRYNLMHDSDEGDGLYWDLDHAKMHVYGNIACLKSVGKRGYGFLYKIGTQPEKPYSIECYNNLAVACNRGFEIVDGLPAASTIHDNAAIRCATPWAFSEVKAGAAVALPFDFGLGKMRAYDSDPGFVDMEHLDFRLRPGARLLSDLPGFQPIPVEKIGLYVDEYRKKLPDAEEIDRYNRHSKHSNLGYEILDRK